MTLTTKKAESITSNPTIANKNLFLAEAIFSGSPRDTIHWIPEIITITKAKKLPRTIKLFTIVWKKTVPEFSRPPCRALGMPEGAAKSWGPAEPPGTLNWANLVTCNI